MQSKKVFSYFWKQLFSMSRKPTDFYWNQNKGSSKTPKNDICHFAGNFIPLKDKLIIFNKILWESGVEALESKIYIFKVLTSLILLHFERQ